VISKLDFNVEIILVHNLYVLRSVEMDLIWAENNVTMEMSLQEMGNLFIVTNA